MVHGTGLLSLGGGRERVIFWFIAENPRYRSDAPQPIISSHDEIPLVVSFSLNTSIEGGWIKDRGVYLRM